MSSRMSMLSVRRRRRMLYLFTGSLFMCSLAIALMPVSNELQDKTRLILYCVGAFFWIGLIGTVAMTIKINQNRKASHRFHEIYGNRKQFGLIHFFQNGEAFVMDVVMFISIASLIIAEFCKASVQIISIIIAVFVFSFGMHCMLNGMNYKYINYSKYAKEQKEDE